jgi:hypothetical protein
VLGLIACAGSVRYQMLENTTVMERIDLGTLVEVAKLLRRPDFDCHQIACDAWVEKRNAAARARLEAILANNSLSDSRTHKMTRTRFACRPLLSVAPQSLFLSAHDISRGRPARGAS